MDKKKANKCFENVINSKCFGTTVTDVLIEVYANQEKGVRDSLDGYREQFQ